MFARIAVSAATYAIDRPYDYRIPEELQLKVQQGIRVFVPFGKGNRVTEGIVLSLSQESSYPDCKEIIRTADPEPLISKEQLRLALFMRDRYFCTVYDAVKVMLPAGLWFDRSGRQKSRDKTREMVRLIVPTDEAAAFVEAKRARAPKQAELVDLLCSFEVLSSLDLMQFTGAGRATLKTLESKQIIELFQMEVLRRVTSGDIEELPLPELNVEQQKALDMILKEQADEEKRGVVFFPT